jgi:hypothetical protein
VNDNRPSGAAVRPFGHPVQFGFGIAPEVAVHLQRAAHLVGQRDASLAVLERIDPDDQVGGQCDS